MFEYSSGEMMQRTTGEVTPMGRGAEGTARLFGGGGGRFLVATRTRQEPRHNKKKTRKSIRPYRVKRSSGPRLYLLSGFEEILSRPNSTDFRFHHTPRSYNNMVTIRAQRKHAVTSLSDVVMVKARKGSTV